MVPYHGVPPLLLNAAISLRWLTLLPGAFLLASDPLRVETACPIERVRLFSARELTVLRDHPLADTLGRAGHDLVHERFCVELMVRAVESHPSS